MRILIVKLSSIGDLFHALPAAHDLKTGLSADIDWVVQDAYVETVKYFSDVNRVIPFYRKAFFGNLRPFWRELRAYEYDYIIDLQGLLKSALVARMARGKVRIGPSFHREGSRLFYSAIAGKPNRNRHAVEQNLDVVRYLGLNVQEPVFPVQFPEKKINDPRPRVALLPISRWPTKNWPATRFVELVERLQAARDVSVFIMGGSGDARACAEIEGALQGRVTNLAGRITLVESGSLLKEMDLLISNDSGPMHMGAALGTPCLVIFGPTDQVRTGPYGDIHRVVTGAVDCRPCFSRKCPKEGIPCLLSISADKVGQVALEMLAKCPE